MAPKETLSKLSAKIADLDEAGALDLTRRLMASNVDPLRVIDVANQGMIEVGERYEKGQYFISGLIMAGEIMQQIGQILLPLVAEGNPQREVGRIVIGTVEGDIHFIGKDIFKAMVRAHGFTVHDLGVDVSRHQFMAAIEELAPQIVAFSCMITSCLEAMRATIAHLRANVPPPLAPAAYLAGGRCMDPKNGRKVGADFWTTDGMDGVRLCQQVLAPKSPVSAGGR